MKFKSVKGTRDILPPESFLWQKAEETVRSVMHRFNYREIRTPVFEETALFARSIGELTDIVGKEMYTFTDRSGTSLTLKPEMTAGVVRAYIQNNMGGNAPLVKVYYLSPMFRQERPQAGRLRQFHQYGAEAIGGSSYEIDAEIIALATAVLRGAGVTEYRVRINSVGCEKCRPGYKTKLQDFFRPKLASLSEESRARFGTNPLRILDSKNDSDGELAAGAPFMKDNLCGECRAHFAGLMETLPLFGISAVVDGAIVRGLDYYTKTAFEITSTDLGSQDALVGGGRYDLLAEELGGKRTPAVGFAAGMERLLMVKEKQSAEAAPALSPALFIAAADDAGRKWAFANLMQLRDRGISVETDFLGRSLKSQMREADRQQARFVIVVGQNEVAGGKGTMKEMATGNQVPVGLDSLASAVEIDRGGHPL
ncbi:MAG TPA: histidine--tRNA ligase [Bacteroidota bacterium]|nr:histidine--tRNA ligase [Bacteroidota bacterium]